MESYFAEGRGPLDRLQLDFEDPTGEDEVGKACYTLFAFLDHPRFLTNFPRFKAITFPPETTFTPGALEVCRSAGERVETLWLRLVHQKEKEYVYGVADADWIRAGLDVAGKRRSETFTAIDDLSNFSCPLTFLLSASATSQETPKYALNHIRIRPCASSTHPRLTPYRVSGPRRALPAVG